MKEDTKDQIKWRIVVHTMPTPWENMRTEEVEKISSSSSSSSNSNSNSNSSS